MKKLKADWSKEILATNRYRIFQFSTQKYKDYGTQNYNFARFIWVWILVAHIEGRT
jgi:hypothetical protein